MHAGRAKLADGATELVDLPPSLSLSLGRVFTVLTRLPYRLDGQNSQRRRGFTSLQIIDTVHLRTVEWLPLTDVTASGSPKCNISPLDSASGVSLSGWPSGQGPGDPCALLAAS